VKFVLFYHSLVSDWNHGNAHFLRGVAMELLGRGHEVVVYEPRNSWSYRNLLEDAGAEAVTEFQRAFPRLRSKRYELRKLDLEEALRNADVVIVHEWNDPELVQAIGDHRARVRAYRLFFHDTHHRAATEPEAMSRFNLEHYDGVLAYGDAIRELYLKRRWTRKAWTWHEAADVRVFHPRENGTPKLDLVWIGNWGDGERARELHQFLIEPVRRLGLRARVHGVRYPDEALRALREANIEYAGWIANHRVPEVFANARLTVHVPRRAYRDALPGIPTIRPFEALACGIPLISAPWSDTEKLFTPGDFLFARNTDEMTSAIGDVLQKPEIAQEVAARGLAAIRGRHTCAHRVDQLMGLL
jgi:spore maturation protein CgeB